MTDRFLQLGAWAVFAIILGITLINAGYMLVSPDAWFSLPRWLRLRGSQSRELYEDRWSALQLRVLGAVMIAAAVWVAFELMPAVGSR